ncbi:TRAP transporter large permease subunit [Chachezhania sediminis]
MIPPSILFVLYGMFTGQSIGMLLPAGILPGWSGASWTASRATRRG